MSLPTTDPLALRKLAGEIAAKQLKARHSVLAQIETFEPGWMTGWMHRDVCAHLDGAVKAIEDNSIVGGARLLIELPPGVGKTLMAGVHLISNTIGRHPDWQIIYGTFNFDKAAEVGRDTRLRIRDPRFAEIHRGFNLDTSAQSMDYLLTDQGGKVSFVGVEGGGMGKRAHLFIVDDPFKNEEDGRSEAHQEKVFRWIMSTVLTRLHPGGAVIVMHQRWHTHDLIGRLKTLTAASTDVDQWYDYRYPMVAEEDEKYRLKGEPLHPERFSAPWCARRKATLFAAKQEWTWQSMYQQNPVLDTGMVFKREWFRFFTLDQLPKNVTWCLTTDFAATAGGGDATVSWPFAIDEHDNIYFIDPYHAHVELDVSQAATFDILQERSIYKVFVEKGVLWNANKAGYRSQAAAHSHYAQFVEFARTRKKREHAAALMGHMSQGKVFFLDSHFTHATVIPEFINFTGEPGVKEVDDLVDAASLPLLSWNKIDRPSPDLPEESTLPSIPSINQQILDVIAPRKKRNPYALFAGDVDREEAEDEDDDK